MLVDIQMINKRLRIIFSVTQEEYDKIKELSGIATISAFIRSKLFGIALESNKKEDDDLKGWIKFLMTIEDRNAIFNEFIKQAEYARPGDPIYIFKKRLINK